MNVSFKIGFFLLTNLFAVQLIQSEENVLLTERFAQDELVPAQPRGAEVLEGMTPEKRDELERQKGSKIPALLQEMQPQAVKTGPSK